MSEPHALRVMMTAHGRGTYAVAVNTRMSAEANTTNATSSGRPRGVLPAVHDQPKE